MNQLQLFLPCASGVEPLLEAEVKKILGHTDAKPVQAEAVSAGVLVQASWREAMQLNLWSRLASRVLVQLQRRPYRSEQDIYEAAHDVAWELWFTPSETFKVELTARGSPLKSLNFAALRIKDALCDRFRAKSGSRPSVDTHAPDARVYAHLTNDRITLYIDTSGEPLFKRGWRDADGFKGDAPLKETLAAAMIAASGWTPEQPLYDPCCGSGTIVIEAAQMALGIAPGHARRFGFEKLRPYEAHIWNAIKNIAGSADSVWANGIKSLENAPNLQIHGSDVAHRMVDFAQRNAERAGVARVLNLRGGDALQRKPPCALHPELGAMMLLNPPYNERIAVAGFAGAPGRPAFGAEPRAPRTHRAEPRGAAMDRDEAFAHQPQSQRDTTDTFFEQLAAHWKSHYDGWTAWMLTPDLKLPGRMRLKETRRVPMWNGPIECRLFRFDIRGRREAAAGEASPDSPGQTPA
jgi:putative N6-adenine-specific DNA methylase